MAISSVTHHTQFSAEEAAFPKEPEENQPDYKIVNVDINFIDPDSYVNGVMCNIKKLKQVSTPVDLFCYSDIKGVNEYFDFKRDGFTFIKLEKEGPLAKKLGERMQDGCTDESLQKELEKFLLSWAQENGIQGIPLLKSAALHRSSVPIVQGSHSFTEMRRPFNLAHIDYSQEKLADGKAWEGIASKCRVAEQFDLESGKSYEDFVPKDAVFFNTWMWTNKKPSNNGLAFLIPNSLPNLQKCLKPFSADGCSTSFSLFPPFGAKFITVENLGLDECPGVWIFNTATAIHAAYNRTDIPEAPRTSVEFRGFCVTPPPATPTDS
jgi:hypothetical protein